MRPFGGSIVAVLLLNLLPGCATTKGVRYVYQDGDYGVVGIPENTNRWPTYYRRQAENLMANHFPEGHKIVRAEEVVEGSRTLTLQGSNTAELTPQLPSEILRVGKLGLSSSRSQADTVKIKECRIIYRRSPQAEVSTPFTDLASLSPAEYLDPNESERRKEEKELADRAAGKPAVARADGKGPSASSPEASAPHAVGAHLGNPVPVNP